ncbi:MAG: Uma2 family endonuclease, partial [Myxococcales bacterium]|nr:Uma2 family endonuclease [Myxococcales bacterium]
MSDLRKYLQPDGPFRAADIRPGDYYELYRGHPIECAPTGGDGARGVATGVHVLDTDPDVEELGVDAGFAPEPKTLWAPDIAVGRVPDKPGWIAGVPPLAVEYAGPGQDDETLAAKIAGLLSHGTRYIWVVKLTGPRRVEVYTADEPVKTLGPGEVLRAPGVLRNPVPVEALYDRRKSLELAFSNLLQREGYNSLDEVRAEGLLAGIEKGIEKGIEQGIEKGIEQGIEKGIEQGIEKGIEQG